MKNLELRSALIKSALFMGLCIFIIYAFAVGDSGGIGGTISSLFSGVLFLVGLVLAVLVSILIMFGIYFGILYMYDKDVCKKTYKELQEKGASSSKYISDSMSSSCCVSTGKKTPAKLMEDDLEPLRSGQDKLNNQLSGLAGSIESLEKTLTGLSTSVTGVSEELVTVSSRTATMEEELENKAPLSSVEDSAKKFSADISTLQNSIQPLSDKLAELEETLSAGDAGDDDSEAAVQEKIDQAVSGLQAELGLLKESIQTMAQSSPEESPADDETTHRILSYFANKKDEKKFVSLVNDAIAKEMTYAEAGEFLNDSLSAAAAEVIADHPSLTKDYIKECRKNS